MAEILTIIVGLLDAPAKIKQYVIDPLKVQFSYLCCSNSVLESLKAEVQRLDDTRDSLQLDVDAARRNLQIIGPDVEHWFESVDKIKENANSIFEAIPEIKQGCANARCPNLKLRYSVSREAKKLTRAVVEVRAAGKFDRIGRSAPPPVMEIIPVASGTEFESRKTKEEEIMAALRDDSVYMIGICGMGGVGKTTMVNKIGKRASAENLFDAVAMVVVSQRPDRSWIQQQIAEALGLQLEEKTISIRASKIHSRLMDSKKILIIIDDIWAWINLEELGIPSQSNHRGCKIILTSRDGHVCTEMKATKVFPLDSLLEKEAWALFSDEAGIRDRRDHHDLHQIAEDVAKECKGLPLALVVLGRALKGRSKCFWEDIREQLRKSAASSLEDVYQPLKLSYNYLEKDEIRDLFLLCCLFPEDSRISPKDLLYYGVGLRIFSDVETMREARNRVYSLVEILASRYMLMDDGTEEGIKYVKMHDVIRDMALSIASTGKHVFMTSHGLEDWPRKDLYETYTCISLSLKYNVTLPKCINCPTLKILRMQLVCYAPDTGTIHKKGKLQWVAAGQVPDTFFDRMRELNVLDIGGIRSLPSSLLLLTNLRTLRLRGSKMRTVSMIGQLVKLEILDLTSSELDELPKEIGGLENLKSLDLSGCSQLRVIAPGVISSLKLLEELFMLGSFKNWEAVVEGKERRNASLVEIASLKNLTALQLHIPDPKDLPQDKLHWRKLESFAIWLGVPLWFVRVKDYGDNNLHLFLNETTPLVHALTKKAHCLTVDLGGMGASDELIKSIQEGNQNLKSLDLNDCEVISFGGSPFVRSYDALKCLRLQNLCKLTHFWDQKFSSPNLSQVYIQNCSSLQYVFLQSAAKSLSRLETLDIQECPILEEVFKAERGESTEVVSAIVFCNLTKLRLKELPSLNSFCKVVNGIDFPSLRNLHIESLHNLEVFCPMEESSFKHNSDSQFFFHQKVTFASLVELKLCKLSTATKIFSSQVPIDSFSRLELLEVESCPNLKVIFSLPAFRNFRTLRHLTVKNCSELEKVVGKEDEESQAAFKELLFPELKALILSELPNFKTFCHMKNDAELPQLESIIIVDCHKMKTFSLGSLSLPRLTRVSGFLDPDLTTHDLFKKEVTFASLVEMKLYNIKTATKIFSSQVPIDSFSRLELLEVESCPNLKVIVSPPAFKNFRTLRHMTVKNCLELEEVVGKKDEESQAAVKEPLFPELKDLILSELPNFKIFCHMKNDIELPQLESITIEDCPQMERFSLGSLSFPCLTYVFGLLEPERATQIFFKAPRCEIHLENDSFTISTKDLSILDSHNIYSWEWFLAKDSSDNFIVIARQLNIWKLRISGRFEMVKLSPVTLYEVVFEIKLKESSFRREGPVNIKLTRPEGITEEHSADLECQPRGKWLEVLAGEFTTSPDPIGELEFSLYGDDIRGLHVKGVTIRPKI